MKRRGWWLALLLVLGFPGWAQDENPGPTQKPTLGPAPGPGPSLNGPRTSNTHDLRKLRLVRSLYVERIDNSLGDKLVEALSKLGRFRLVSQAKDADATLRGSCLESRRLKRVHSEVFIADRSGTSLWQDNLYRPYNPPPLAQAVDETARLVADHLGESLLETGRD